MEIYRFINEIYKEHLNGVRISGDRFFNIHQNTTMKTQGNRTFDPCGAIIARLIHDALFCSIECVGILPATLIVSDKVKHEAEINRRILEIRHGFTENSILKATSYDQTRDFETMWSTVATPRKRKSKPTPERNGAVTKQTSTLALNNHLTPIPEEEIPKQRLQTSCQSEEGNIPSPMRYPPTELQEPTLLE
ncbi:hypothetical protein MKX03_010314 [Papaver bracteatum]|nr:hypothetical protein MKX03_010314 [Papaver bracteatum]